jgi:hypothetical protein
LKWQLIGNGACGGQIEGKRAVMSSRNVPYGLTWLQKSGVSARCSVARMCFSQIGSPRVPSGWWLAVAGEVAWPNGMTRPASPSYAGHRFPAEIISHAVWLYFRFPLNLRMVEEMLTAPLAA